jgi:NAD(P)-dependent dehydrogenase (short-subunit alcohol dehydrogenase family)
MTLDGASRCALVTGSSRGIGRGIALKLAEQGVKVAIHYYQNSDAASRTLAEVRSLESDGFIVQADISRPEDVRGLFQQVEDHFGGLDIFVSNARPELPTFYQPPLELTLDSWRMAVDSQATAFLVGAQEASRVMQAGGRMLAITYAPSARTGSWQPWIGMGSAKAAVEALVRYFAVALARKGITVNAVSPGLTEDSVLNGLPPEIQSASHAWHESGWTPMGRMGTPADIGNAVALLCSPEAGWITGQTIYADGGSSLMDTVFPLEIQGVGRPGRDDGAP